MISCSGSKAHTNDSDMENSDTVSTDDGNSIDNEVADEDADTDDRTDTAGDSDKTDSADSDDSAEDNDADTGSSGIDFDKSCETSGGIPTDGVCVCDKVVCDPGIVCNVETKKCANYVESECSEDTPKTCTNDETGIGNVIECQNGHLFSFSCKTVSCNEAGSDCGECLNEIGNVCINDSEDNGFTAHCNNGTLVKKEECLKVFYDEDYAEYYDSCEHFSSIPDCNEDWLKDQFWNHVSCVGDKCGECINYSNICVNDEENHGKIYECVNGKAGKHKSDCENGVLADYDGNHDNIACTCVESGNNNGGCSSNRNCYAAQTAATGVEICQPAK